MTDSNKSAKNPKRTSPRKRSPVKKPKISAAPCDCPSPCEGKPAGTLFCCEDGVLVDIIPPNYFAVMVFDPSRPGGLPYFEKPENFPPAVIQAMLDAAGPVLP